ncbi:MAG: hypothetical protein IKO19_13355 [Candidatus Riflebacteria bacterium]|nr:hypothetical protein [Candidatus Riflebacteria bacterium]
MRLIVTAFSDFIKKERRIVDNEIPNQTIYKSLENNSDNSIPTIKTATKIGNTSGLDLYILVSFYFFFFIRWFNSQVD